MYHYTRDVAQTKDYTKEILELRMRDFSLREIAKALKISLAKVQRTLDKPEIKHALAEAKRVYEQTQAAQSEAKIESLHYVLAKKVIKSLSDSVEDIEKKKTLCMHILSQAVTAGNVREQVSIMHLWARLENLRLHTVKSTYDILSLEATDGTLESKLSDASDSKDIVQVIFDS